MHTIFTANLSDSIVISACHYMKEKIKTFQMLLCLNTSYSVKTAAPSTRVCVCVCSGKRRWHVKSKTLGPICWFYLGFLVEMQRDKYVPKLPPSSVSRHLRVLTLQKVQFWRFLTTRVYRSDSLKFVLRYPATLLRLSGLWKRKIQCR